MGRASKIKIYGIGNTINRLHANGSSLQQICNTLNKEYLGLNLNKNDVSRFLRGLTKSASVDEETGDVLEYITNEINRISYQIDRSSSINIGDRRVIKSVISSTRNKIINKVKCIGGSTDSKQSVDIIRKLITDFCKELCITCRKRVNHLTCEEIERREKEKPNIDIVTIYH